MRVLIPPAEPQRLAFACPLKLAQSYLNLRIRLRIDAAFAPPDASFFGCGLRRPPSQARRPINLKVCHRPDVVHDQIFRLNRMGKCAYAKMRGYVGRADHLTSLRLEPGPGRRCGCWRSLCRGRRRLVKNWIAQAEYWLYPARGRMAPYKCAILLLGHLPSRDQGRAAHQWRPTSGGTKLLSAGAVRSVLDV